MKNTPLSILACVCLILCAFLVGLYLGRNLSGPDIQTEVLFTEPAVPTGTTAATAPSSPNLVTTVPTQPGKININTADIDALQQIPGIGPSIAEAIITYRDSNGPFHDPAQLLNIPGIGEKKLVTLLDYVYWEE